jgi:hypothetical protein
MPANYVLTDIPYTLADVKLGSLLSNIKKPHQDAKRPSRTLRKGADFTHRHQKNFKFVYDLNTKSSIRARNDSGQGDLNRKIPAPKERIRAFGYRFILVLLYKSIAKHLSVLLSQKIYSLYKVRLLYNFIVL